MLIQACQEANKSLAPLVNEFGTHEPDPAPTQLSDPHSHQHITLSRPHTVLLLATVRGGVAYRGVFTGASSDLLTVLQRFTQCSPKLLLKSNKTPNAPVNILNLKVR